MEKNKYTLAFSSVCLFIQKCDKSWLRKNGFKLLSEYYDDGTEVSEAVVDAICSFAACYFQYLHNPPNKTTQKDCDTWKAFGALFENPSKLFFSANFCRQFSKLPLPKQKLLLMVLLKQEPICWNSSTHLLSTGPLLYSSTYKYDIKQDLSIISCSYIYRSIRFYQSKVQKNAHRMMYTYFPVIRMEAIVQSQMSDSAMYNLISSQAKTIRYEIQVAAEADMKCLTEIVNSPSSKAKGEPEDKAPEIRMPSCLPLPGTFKAPVFRTITKKDYKPEGESSQAPNNIDYSMWPYAELCVSLDEEGNIARPVCDNHAALELVYQSQSVAPETLIEHDLPSSINANETMIRKISCDLECVQSIFQKLSALQKGPQATNEPALQLSPQEEEVLSLPDNVLLLGRSGTGKTTCALLRLFARYRLFEEYKKSQYVIDEEDETYSERYHPLFVTLSPVLCSQAKKYFQKLVGEYSASEAAPPSFHLKEDQFPLFLTLRQLLRMLDATCSEPFFAHDADSSMDWKNDDGQGLVQIIRRKRVPIPATVEDLVHENRNPIFLNRIEQSVPMTVTKEVATSFEINYEYFAEEIFPAIKYVDAGLDFHPSVVWTEIQSHIKGSLAALNTSTGFLTKKQYINQGKKRGIITKEQRFRIYRYFVAYEQKKRELGAFDLQDIIYHLYSRMKYEGYRGTIIHAITIDEVQDFSQSTLQLLMMLCKQQNGFFFTGDTCQTIARGVGFRFQELQALFHHRLNLVPLLKSKYPVPEVHQLTVNFRSHSQLIKLGNSVVRLLEKFFPATIDVLAEDQGSYDGPVPSLMQYTSNEDLFAFLHGQSAKFGPQGVEKPEIEQFGANQVVLTRNQATKAQLPDLLKHALCLTIYEAKGLEFNDVILFNFFTDSQANDAWRVLNSVRSLPVADARGTASPSGIVHLQPYEGTSDEEEVNEEVEEEVQEGATKYADFKSVNTRVDSFNHNAHSILCSEFKHLYVALTRARTNLYIFEKDVEKVSCMLRYWVDAQPEPLVQVADIHSFVNKGIVKSTTAEEWRKQGEIMLQHQYFPQAIQCFTYSKDENLVTRATALLKTKNATEMQQRAHGCVNAEEASSLRSQAEETFRSAAEMFLEVSMLQEAAQCFASCGEFKKSGHLFQEIGLFVPAGDAFAHASEHRLAAECYFEAKEIEKAVYQFIQGNEWIDALRVMRDYTALVEHTSIERIARDAVSYFLNQSDIPWQLLVQCISFLSEDVSVKLDKAIQDPEILTNELLDQFDTWEMTVLNMELIHSHLTKHNNFLFYKKLQSYCFINCARVHDNIQILHTKLANLDSTQEEERTELVSQLRSALKDMRNAVDYLLEEDQLSLLTIFGYFSLISQMAHSPLAVSVLQSVSDNSNALRLLSRQPESGPVDNALRIRVLIDYAFDIAFSSSPLSFEKSPEVLRTMEEIEQLLTICATENASGSLQALQLLQCCLQPGTRLPFLVDYFTKQRKYEGQHRATKYFFIASFLLLASPQSYPVNLVIQTTVNLIDQIIDFLRFIENPKRDSSPSFVENLLSLLCVFNTTPEIQHCTGFPICLLFPTEHIFDRLMSRLRPNQTTFPLSSEERKIQAYFTEEILSTAFYTLLSTCISLLSFACYDLPKIFKKRENLSCSLVAHKISVVIPFLFSSVLQGQNLLQSVPKKKMQWLLNEYSLTKYSRLLYKVDRMLTSLATRLDAQWNDPNNPVALTSSDKEIILSFARFKWKYLHMFEEKGIPNSPTTNELLAVNHTRFYRSGCTEIQNLLSISNQQDVLYEWLLHDTLCAPDYPISVATAKTIQQFFYKMDSLPKQGYLLQSIQCLNQFIDFVYDNEHFVYLEISETLIEKHFCYGMALFSALEHVDVVVAPYYINWLYELPCDPFIPGQLSELMEALLQLFDNIARCLNMCELAVHLLPMTLLSYNCSIPSAGYDDDLLNMIWDSKDRFYASYQQIEFLECHVPLLTGEPSSLTQAEFIEELEKVELLTETCVTFQLTEYQAKPSNYHELYKKEVLTRAQRITAAHKITRFFKQVHSKKPIRPIAIAYSYLNDQLKFEVSTRFAKEYRALADYYQQVLVALQESSMLPHILLFEGSLPVLQAYQMLRDLAHSKDLITGEYQTVISQYENELMETKEKLKFILEKVNEYNTADEDSTDEQNQLKRGTKLWRERQIQKLLKQRTGLRYQHALQKKAERLREK